jgi:hypothetical protein
VSSKSQQRRRQARVGALTARNGDVIDPVKNTINGVLPLEPGDVFFYRGRGSPAATVSKVRLEKLFGHIAKLILIDAATDEEMATQYVDARRIEVVQMAAPVGPAVEKGPDPTEPEGTLEEFPANELAPKAEPETQAADDSVMPGLKPDTPTDS